MYLLERIFALSALIAAAMVGGLGGGVDGQTVSCALVGSRAVELRNL